MGLISLIGGLIESFPGYLVRQILLFDVMAGIIVGIAVAKSASQAGGTAVMGILKSRRDGFHRLAAY